MKRDWLTITITIIVSVAIHLGILIYFSFAEEAKIAGGAVTEVPLLGSNFEDLVENGDSLEPVTPEELEKIEEIDEAETVEPETPIIEPQKTFDQVKPIKSASIEPIKTIQPIQPQKVAETLKPIEKVKPKKVKKKALPKKVRKKTKPKKPIIKKRAKKKQGSKTAKSSIRQDKGRLDGSTSGKASKKGKNAGKSRKAGNSKISNYPGKVQRRISRTRPRSVGGQGTTRVRFVISSNGRISSISIARSSGSSLVDKAAINHIRRSAPFPKPPQGAQRSFVIPVRIKG